MIGSATLGTSRDWVHILRGESLIESGVTGACTGRARLPFRAMPQQPGEHGSSACNACARFSPPAPLRLS